MPDAMSPTLAEWRGRGDAKRHVATLVSNLRSGLASNEATANQLLNRLHTLCTGATLEPQTYCFRGLEAKSLRKELV